MNEIRRYLIAIGALTETHRVLHDPTFTHGMAFLPLDDAGRVAAARTIARRGRAAHRPEPPPFDARVSGRPDHLKRAA